jgi:hypothetical protein
MRSVFMASRPFEAPPFGGAPHDEGSMVGKLRVEQTAVQQAKNLGRQLKANDGDKLTYQLPSGIAG